MMELITFAFSPINIFFTVLVILIMLYWITVILGVLDVELFDFDLPDDGLNIGADADGDVDVDSGGILRSVLEFFYIGEVPVMLILSIMFLCMWIISMLGNYYLNPARSFLIAIPIYAGGAAVSIFVSRIFGEPLKKMYALFNNDSNAPRQVAGRICTVVTTSVGKNMGQAEVSTKGAPILLNVVSDSDHIFHKGDEAVIVGMNEEQGVYRIAPVDIKK